MNYDDVVRFIHGDGQISRASRIADEEKLDDLIFLVTHIMTDDEFDCALKASGMHVATEFGFKLN